MEDLKLKGLIDLYSKFRPQIEARIKEFLELKEASEERILKEFLFCHLTPQSKAEYCWRAVENLFANVDWINSNIKILREKLSGVRFPNQKARYILQNINLLRDKAISLKKLVYEEIPSAEKRDFIVRTFKGLGFKEASHFLRNTGHLDLAILDRHILKNLHHFGVIEEVPKTLTQKKYLEIEAKFKEFAQKINVPFAHLDLLFWAKETGKVFK